jgi:hypothetical protein
MNLVQELKIVIATKKYANFFISFSFFLLLNAAQDIKAAGKFSLFFLGGKIQ